MDYSFRPIDRWPGTLTQKRRGSPFRTTWGRTLELLDRELVYLDAHNVVFQVAMQESDIRLDGRPRARATATHPGVIVAFDSKYGPLKYATDVFSRCEDNVRAIALGLEALRKVDRYGITKRGEQYTGWRQIEQHAGTGFASADDALAWVADQMPDRFDGATPFDEAYRVLARRLHPDAPGGSHDAFVRLQQARELIEA